MAYEIALNNVLLSILFTVIAWFIGRLGWVGIITALKHYKEDRRLLKSMTIWILIMGAVAFVWIEVLGEMEALVGGYCLSLWSIIKSGGIY